MVFRGAKTLAQKVTINQKLCKNNVLDTSRNISFGYLLQPPQKDDFNNYSKQIFFMKEKQEDHDGPISLTWADIISYLILNFHTSRSLWDFFL